jgi:hypothetical protein
MPRIRELHLATGLALLLTFTGLSLAPDLITVPARRKPRLQIPPEPTAAR